MSTAPKTSTAPLWDTMDAEAFGADTPGVLFDASALTRGADKYGTPDLFSAMAEDEQSPVWVRNCNHVGCIITAKHTHGVR